MCVQIVNRYSIAKELLMTANGISGTALRKKREREHKRDVILQAAFDLFAEYGYEHVSVSQIAERAEFATGTIYNFFKNKAELYHALVYMYMEKGYARIRNVFDEYREPVECLKNYFRVKIELFHEHRNLARMYVTEMNGQGILHGELHGYLRDIWSDVLIHLSDVFARGIDSGVFRDGNPELLASAAHGMTTSFVMRMLIDSQYDNPLNDIEQLIDIFLDGIRKR